MLIFDHLLMKEDEKMIRMSTKQKIIIRKHQFDQSERKIARELKISRTTVRRYLKAYERAREELLCSGRSLDEVLIDDLVKPPTYNALNRGKKKYTEEMDKEIDRLLDLNDQKRSRGMHKQMMKKVDIFEHLKQKGFDIGYTSICHYIGQKQIKRKQAFIRQVYTPGDVCEFDWGEVKLEIEGQIRRLQMAVFTPANSNYRYGFLFNRQDTASFMQAHVQFFEHVGGVYHTMVYDNMRVAIRRFVGPSEKQPTEALLKLSMYYQFDFRFCNLYSGNEKGHVERSVEFVRRKSFCTIDSFPSVSSANEHLVSTCNQLNTRFSPRTQDKSPVDLLAIEKQYLKELPPAFDCGVMEGGKVDKYSVITYQTNRYSVPDHLVGKRVDIKIYPEKLVCYHENKKICQHERHFSRSQWYINLDHYLYTLHRKPGALAGSQALSSAPQQVKQVYNKYFSTKAKDFVELLIFLRDHDLDFKKVNDAIEILKRTCPHNISADMIKVLCLQQSNHNGQYEASYQDDDQILQQSRRQLEELSLFLAS